jgi:hypothetical protein
MLKADDGVVRVAGDDHVARRLAVLLALIAIGQPLAITSSGMPSDRNL